MKTLVAGLVLLISSVVHVKGQDKQNSIAPHAQALAEAVIKANPGMLDIIFHVMPPRKEKNIVIAAHIIKAIGEDSGDDDLGVMHTGKPLVEVQKDGIRIGVLVQLKDRKGNAIGALGLMYPYAKGQDPNNFLNKSNMIRDGLSHKIGSLQELFPR